ncbi:MAG: InlB B-repeat-containing protein [Chloroflexota bacterium]
MGWATIHIFTPEQYTLKTVVSPPDGGRITASLDGMEAKPGTEVMLSVVAAGGYVFDSWAGAAEGTMPLMETTLDGNTRVTARFRPARVDVTDPDVVFDLPCYASGVQVWYASVFSNLIGEYVPSEEYTFMLIDLVIQNSDFVPFSSEAACFAVRVDGKDYPSRPDVRASGLPSEDLRNRECAVGRLVFEVPAGDSGHEPVYMCGEQYELQWIPSD